MKLTNESIKTIKLGDVINLSLTDYKNRTDLCVTGVVFANDHSGLKLNLESSSTISLGFKLATCGSMYCEILKDHPPGAEFNGEFDYVCKHM